MLTLEKERIRKKGFEGGREIGCKNTKPMNIISYNVRGLGRGVKWAAIRRMVRKEKIDLLCIQETKTENIDMSVCHICCSG